MLCDTLFGKLFRVTLSGSFWAIPFRRTLTRTIFGWRQRLTHNVVAYWRRRGTVRGGKDTKLFLLAPKSWKHYAPLVRICLLYAGFYRFNSVIFFNSLPLMLYFTISFFVRMHTNKITSIFLSPLCFFIDSSIAFLNLSSIF